MTTSDSDTEHTDLKDLEAAFLKDNFTLRDFMSCAETRDILETEHYQRYCEKCEKHIGEWYRHKCEIARRTLSSVLSYDHLGTKLGVLSAIVYANLEREYDLETFYLTPVLAQPLIDEYEDIKKREEAERMRKMRESLAENPNACKVFDWSTKTYK